MIAVAVDFISMLLLISVEKGWKKILRKRMMMVSRERLGNALKRELKR